MTILYTWIYFYAMSKEIGCNMLDFLNTSS